MSVSLSSLVEIKTKSTCRYFVVISNIFLTYTKVQIHTKDLSHTLSKDKQEPH